MNAHTSLWLAIPIALMLPLGCNNGSTTADPANAPETVGAAPAAQAAAEAPSHHHRGHHARGPVAMMFKAAKSLDVSADQRTTIDKLTAEMHGDRATMRAPQQALHAALVAGVKAGNVDLARLAPLQAAVDEAHQAHAAREASALNALYASLQPAQRQALVANVREKQAERAARWGSEHEHAEGRAMSAPGAQRIARMTSELGLDAAQQQRVATFSAANEQAPAAKADFHAAMKARTEALLTAFASDSFDASKLELGGRANMGRGQHAAFLAKLVPVLRADQREALAASMQAHKD